MDRDVTIRFAANWGTKTLYQLLTVVTAANLMLAAAEMDSVLSAGSIFRHNPPPLLVETGCQPGF